VHIRLDLRKRRAAVAAGDILRAALTDKLKEKTVGQI
jgi:hypothetical protein